MATQKSGGMKAPGGLAALFNRPKTEYVDKEGEEISISPQPSDLIYIRKCKQCKFRVHKKAAKCIIESCTDVKVELEDFLISGTLEMIDCQSVTISINPQDQLPTVSAERSRDLHLYYYDPRAFGSVYTVDCSDVCVHFQPPYREEHKLELPDDREGQYVTEMRGSKMIVSKVIREGCGHTTTAEKQKIALKKEAEMKRQVENYLMRLITIKPKAAVQGTPDAKPTLKEPPQPTLKEPPQAEPQQTTDSDKPQADQAADSAKTQAEKTADSATTQAEEKTADSAQPPAEQNADSATPQADPEDNPLLAALQAKRRDLKPTETVERSLPVVGVEEEQKGGGARYNIEDEESKKEYFDSEESLEKKVERVAKWVRGSKHIIFFTGAGVSTSAGIPDFRSGMNTVLKTGPGVWELMAHKSKGREGSEIKAMLQALPTPTHMAIVKLQEAGVIKFTVSQNVDGLHRRSGLGPAQLAELHGNTNLETCHKCQRQYLRDFETREAYDVFDHRTSRDCEDPNCRGYLDDSIINFGENLPERELTNAFDHARKADLCIVLGSSLRVRPACQVPEVVLGKGGRVVICNLQRIPQFPPDNRTMQVFAKCDDFMSTLMAKLGHDIPPFTLKRRARVAIETKEGGQVCVSVTGLDRDEDLPYSFIKLVTIEQNGQTHGSTEEPHSLTLPSPSTPDLPVTLHFHGHYGEPPLVVNHPLTTESTVYCMNYDPMTGEWVVKNK